MHPISNPIIEDLKLLMEKQPFYEGKYPGIPFVNSDSEFGIVCKSKVDALHAIYHLLESLEHSNFFEGERAPETDFDTLKYTFYLGKTVTFYEGVFAHRTEDSMELTIRTKKPVFEIVKAIKLGIAEAESKINKRNEENKLYSEKVREEFKKENVFPLFSVNDDISFVRAYLQQKISQFFRGQPETHVFGPSEPHDYLRNIFSDYDIVDTRPRFEALTLHTEEDYSPLNDLINDVLTKIFTCPHAVQGKREPRLPQESPERLIAFKTAAIQKSDIDNPFVSIEIRGDPSRLARDIVKNDSDIAKLIAAELGLIIPEDDNYGLVEEEMTPPLAIGAEYPPLQLG